MPMNNNIPVVIDPQVLYGTYGNTEFQTVNDFVEQSFLTSKLVKITGEDKVYHIDEKEELIHRLLELAKGGIK